MMMMMMMMMQRMLVSHICGTYSFYDNGVDDDDGYYDDAEGVGVTHL